MVVFSDQEVEYYGDRVKAHQDAAADLFKHVSVEGKHHLILGGIRSLSSRWAVEEFLKQVAGVRWLFPGDAAYGEIVPSRPTLTMGSGLNQTHEPDDIARANCAMHYYTKGGRYLRLPRL